MAFRYSRGYSTSAYPGGLGQFQADAGILGADVDYGASASLGWQHHRDRSNFSMLYSGTYAGMVRYSDSNAFSQALSLAFSRTLSPKWSLAIAGIGSDSTVAQLLFQPSNIGVISQVPASFDDLAAAFSIGQFSSSQVGSTLTGAPHAGFSRPRPAARLPDAELFRPDVGWICALPPG